MPGGGAVMQIAGTSLSAASYYLFGTLVVAAVARLGVVAGPWARRLCWAAAAGCWAAVLALLPSRMQWQDEQAHALDLPPHHLSPLLIAAGTVLGTLALIALGRLLRVLARALEGPMAWFVPAGWPCVTLAVLGSALAAVALLGLVYQGMVTAYAALDASDAGQRPPHSLLRSGGPGSSQPWESLGHEGREFVSGGLTVDQLRLFRPWPVEPIRVYVGLATSSDSDTRAAEAVAELDRTGAWQRSVLLIAPPTGLGWIDPDAVTSFEAVTGGDIATVSMQYSYLPSWLSFLVDRKASEDSATSLYQAVVEAWRARPAAARPRLVVFGESLGSYGVQAAFPPDAGPRAVTQDADAVLWVGPPAGSRLWNRWRVDLRTGGTPYQPVIAGGRTARVAIGPEQLLPQQPGWDHRRALILAHPVDPVVWWNLPLAYSYPDWLAQRGPGVDPRVRWWPVVTFWTVGLDLAVGGGATPGVGHNYQDETAAAVVAVLRPADWDAGKTELLQQVVDATRPE